MVQAPCETKNRRWVNHPAFPLPFIILAIACDIFTMPVPTRLCMHHRRNRCNHRHR